MELTSIKQVSLDYGISRQMLCYYEEIGLIKSLRKENSSYRVYDEDAIKRLQQIIILRKLQIPMKQIKNILNNPTAVTVIEIFKQNIDELDEQITALSTIKSILTRFVGEMQEKADIHLNLDLLNDKTMLAVMNTFPFSENKINNAKEKITMKDLNKASETLSKFITKSGLINFEIEKFGPCRFIGKTVYASNKRGTGEICEYLRVHSDWIFNELDSLKEYAYDDIHDVALQHWELYDPKSDGLTMYWKNYVSYETYELQGYTVGRFMKADTPVPNGMNYIDIFEIYIAKAWWMNEMPSNLEELVCDEIKRLGIYGRGEPAMFVANVYPVPDENSDPVYGKYIPCIKE